MFSIELDEEILETVTTLVKVLDVLYTSELDFGECSKVLTTLVRSFAFGKLTGMKLDKEFLKDLRDSIQEDLDKYNKKKADETITDFHN